MSERDVNAAATTPRADARRPDLLPTVKGGEITTIALARTPTDGGRAAYRVFRSRSSKIGHDRSK